jgi:hypothetical protein
MTAKNLLKKGETAVVIFTKDIQFFRKPDGTGSSGNWIMNRHRIADRVILYCRKHPRSTADIYLADFVPPTNTTDCYGNPVPPNESPRVVVHFAGCSHVGQTRKNWYQFADTGTNPIRWL